MPTYVCWEGLKVAYSRVGVYSSMGSSVGSEISTFVGPRIQGFLSSKRAMYLKINHDYFFNTKHLGSHKISSMISCTQWLDVKTAFRGDHVQEGPSLS